MTKGALDGTGYSGVRLQRLEYLRQNNPAALTELESRGLLERHLDQTEEAYRREMEELTDPENPGNVMAAVGMTEEMKASDPAKWLKLERAASSLMRELAASAVVETPIV